MAAYFLNFGHKVAAYFTEIGQSTKFTDDFYNRVLYSKISEKPADLQIDRKTL